jgi:type IV pilus assembly protein PilB
MDEQTSSSLSGFASYLADANLLDKKVALDGLQEATLNKVSYISYLTKESLLNATLLAKAASAYYGLPLCDMKALNQDLIPQEFLNIQLVRKRLGLPIFVKDEVLYLATTDPTIENLYDVSFLTGLDVRLVIVEGSQLTGIIDDLLNKLIISEISGPAADEQGGITINPYKEDTPELSTYDVESAPVVNYVNKIIVDACEKGASDIHFERYENDYRIRFRMDGVLYPIAQPPLKLANYLLARIKIMSNLDITEHRVPQDGRFKVTLSKTKSIDFRVSVCPTLYGEKIVLRLLDPSQVFHNIDQLHMEPFQKDHLVNALQSTQGMILVTGPTGSGKTVTLYSALNFLNSTEDNIMTVEDPVEIPLHGINQVHVNPKIGLTFSTALRSFLRQDPDIIMVGEIRDLETADISVKAAQTGHLVLSTLHTNSGPETITRLIYMGIEPYNLASSLVLVMAQRLLRILCQYCKQKETLPGDILLKEGFKLEDIDSLQLFKAGSCERCTNGYKHRMGIFEVMPITQAMALLIMKGANAIEIGEQAKKEGLLSLRENGLDKVKKGLTSLSELNRTAK